MPEMDFLQSPRLQALQTQMESVQSEEDKHRFMITLVKAIIQTINAKTIDKIEGGVNVNNLDEVTASLRNELSNANKPITELLKKLNISTSDQTKVIQDIEEKAIKDFNEQFQTIIVKRVKDIVSVDNLEEITFPSEIKINNLEEVNLNLVELQDRISALKLDVNIEAPQVILQPTPVNIPAPILNVPALDLEPIISVIEDSLKKLRTNNVSNPLSVRLSDGANWIKEFLKIQKETSRAVTAFAGGANQIRLLDANNNIINPSSSDSPTTLLNNLVTVTTAGTRVQISGTSSTCKGITVKALAANTGTMYVGNSTVSATNGYPLTAAQAISFDISNLSTVYIDSSVNGEKVAYLAVN